MGFAEGFCSHAYSLWTGGIHAYGRDPVLIQVLFHAMLVFDALAVVLIIRASPAGPPLAAAAMLADASANWWTQAPDMARHPLRYLVPFGLLPITLFGVFVLVTAIPLYQTIAARRPAADQASRQLA
ncbi:hypothetical protein [Catenulispora yoronensis]|uniref:hypothetical protein n=1 Tax=Catenulispora yoronensis TaxID=450799 RepID=UPI0031DCEFE0